jgi:glutamyl-tRNA reductase
MAHLALVGIDVRQRTFDELERLGAASRDAIAAATRAAALLDDVECVAIVTCNRAELVVASRTSRDLDREALLAAYAAAFPRAATPVVHEDDAALRRLVRVACSLESAALGEEQILGQVRDAFTLARERGLAGPRLARAFDLALRVGRKVRRETDLAALGTDLARLSMVHLRPELRAASAAPVVLLGTGAMAEAILAARPKEGRESWLVVGRDGERAAAVAQRFGATSASLADFLAPSSSFAPIRALVAATNTTTPIVTRELLAARLPLGGGVVDLGVPRNVDPAVRDHARLADLADLRAIAEGNGVKLASTVATIERWIDEAIARARRGPADHAARVETRALTGAAS